MSESIVCHLYVKKRVTISESWVNNVQPVSLVENIEESCKKKKKNLTLGDIRGTEEYMWATTLKYQI